MTGGAVPRPIKRGGPLLLWALLILGAALAGSAAPVSAQFEQRLSEAQGEYEAVLLDYQGRQRTWEVQQGRWRAALDTARAAQASGNTERLDRAEQQFKTASLELQRLRRLVDQLEPLLAQRRRALQQALEEQAESLQAQMTRTTGTQRQQLNVRIGSLLEQISSLEPPAAPAPTLLFFPEFASDPRDGRTEILGKIEFLERRSQEASAYLDRVAADLQRLRRLETQQRMQRDAASNPFGDDPPGARAGRPPEPQSPPGGSNAATQTTQQQIDALTAVKSELEQLRLQLTARISAFRVTLSSMGGDLR
jgi:hypothetical protein